MSLAGELGLGAREVVAFAGAGGKSTLLLALGRELFDGGNTVVLTTTTKMGTDQIPEDAAVLHGVETVGPELGFLLGRIDGPKVIGVAPEVVDILFDSKKVDHILVEADGARRRAIKAPNDSEPVYPARVTTAVVVASLEAVGMEIGKAHRPELVSKILGKPLDATLTAADIGHLLTSQTGGLSRIPTGARVIIALTHEAPGPRASAADLIAAQVSANSRIDRVVSL